MQAGYKELAKKLIRSRGRFFFFFLKLFIVLHYMLTNYGLFVNSHELRLTVQFIESDVKKISLAQACFSDESCLLSYSYGLDLTQKCFSWGGARGYRKRFP